MGETTDRLNHKPGGPTNQAGNGKGNGKTNRDHSNSTQTETTSAGGNPTSRTSTENQESPRLVVVDPPPGTEPTQKKKKNRPTGMTYNKDKPKTPAKSKNAGGETTVLIQSLIQGGFSIAATRLGPHWELSPDEADSIATPTANILARYMDTEKLGKYSDPTALVIALGVTVIPRIMMSSAKKKEVKPHGPTGGNVPATPGNSKPDGGHDRGPVNRDAGSNAETDVTKLLELAVNSPY